MGKFLKQSLKNKKKVFVEDVLSPEETRNKRQKKITNLTIPPLQTVMHIKCLTVTSTSSISKEQYCDLDFQKLINSYPSHHELLREYQLALQEYAIDKSPVTVSGRSIDIKYFFDYLDDSEDGKLVKHLSAIDYAVAYRFLEWLKSKYKKVGSIRIYYSAVTAVIQDIQRTKYGELQEIGKYQSKLFPPCPREKGESSAKKPLDTASYNCLIKYLEDKFNHIKTIPALVEHSIRTGPLLEDMSKNFSRENILWFYHHKVLLKTGSERTSGYSNRDRLINKGFPIEEVKELYKKYWKDGESSGRSPFDKRGRRWLQQNPDYIIDFCLRYLHENHPDYPLNWDPLQVFLFLNSDTAEGALKKGLDKVKIPNYAIISEKMRYAKHPWIIKNWSTGRKAIMYYLQPTVHVVAVCFLLFKAQTGWNTQPAIDFEFNESFNDTFMPCLTGSAHVHIWSIKNKADYKAISHRTKKLNKHGVYQILKFLWEFGRDLREVFGSRSPWVHMEYMLTEESQYTQLTGNSIQEWVRNYGSEINLVNNNGNKINTFPVDIIRKNSAYNIDELTNHDTYRLSKTLGNTKDIADDHYTDFTKKKVRLRKHQEEFLKELKNFQGSFCPKNESLQSIIDKNLDNNQIHIITADGENFISVCTDAYSPDWVGYESRLRKGEKCGFFNGCATCSKSIIFTETLPYAFKRIEMIERQKKRLNPLDWEVAFSSEYAGWNEVIDNWGDRNEVEKAKFLSKSVRLPNFLKFN